LGGGGKSVRCGVGVGEGKHARAEGVARTVFRTGKAELGEGIEAAPDGGAGEAGLHAELRDGHLRGLLRKSLDDDEASGKGGHKVGVAGEDVEGCSSSGLRRCRDGHSGRSGRWEGVVRSKAHADPFPWRCRKQCSIDGL